MRDVMGSSIAELSNLVLLVLLVGARIPVNRRTGPRGLAFLIPATQLVDRSTESDGASNQRTTEQQDDDGQMGKEKQTQVRSGGPITLGTGPAKMQRQNKMHNGKAKAKAMAKQQKQQLNLLLPKKELARQTNSPNYQTTTMHHYGVSTTLPLESRESCLFQGPSNVVFQDRI